MDPKRKYWLFKQSNNFCAVPWQHFKVSVTGNVTTCVNGTKRIGNIATQNIREILSSAECQSIRRSLAADQADHNCDGCHDLENGDYKFLRNLYNPMFKTTPVDYDNQQDFVLAGVDLHWSSLCDLKCITCWEKQSSSIAIERGFPVLHTPTAAADQLIDYIAGHQEHLQEIYLSGGEPTLIKHNLRLLKRLDKDKNFVIRVNTNMMFDQDNQIIAELKKFPRVLLTISADAQGDRFNYIRRGASWDKFIQNLNLLKPHGFSWRVNTVFFVGTAATMAQTQEYFMDAHNIHDFTINQVAMGHPELRCRNLPAHTKTLVRERLQEHLAQYEHNTNLAGQLENCLTELSHEPENSYHEFFEGIDKLAKTNWEQVFPELVNYEK